MREIENSAPDDFLEVPQLFVGETDNYRDFSPTFDICLSVFKARVQSYRLIIDEDSSWEKRNIQREDLISEIMLFGILKTHTCKRSIGGNL